MKVIRGIQKFSGFRSPTCLTIGTFDGVHLGHRAVIKRVVETAAETGATSLVMTFDPHPRSSTAKSGSPPLLTCTAHKLALLKELGVDVCLLAKFDDDFAATPATDFVVETLHKKLGAAGIVVGPRLRFGRGREGTTTLLKRLGERLGFRVEVVEEVFVGNLPVSSTAVRRSVLNGCLSGVEALLGRRFSILGQVVRGRSVGRKLGYRTANINPLDEVIPPLGVYIVEVIVGGERYPGALNIGRRPTFPAGKLPSPTLEVHIIGFDRPIYRKQVEIVFRRRIRDERLFSSPGELAHQIALDIEEVREYFDSPMGDDSYREAVAFTVFPALRKGKS